MTRIIIMGMCGQMGHNIASLAMSKPDEFTVVAGVDKFPKENPWGIPVEKSIFKVEQEADVIIDAFGFDIEKTVSVIASHFEELNGVRHGS